MNSPVIWLNRSDKLNLFNSRKYTAMVTAAFALIITALSTQAEDLHRVDKIPASIKSVKVITPIYNQKVLFRLPTSWNLAFKHQKGPVFTMEFIPRDEDINSWKNLLTIQGFNNIAEKVTPEKFLTGLSERFKLTCGLNVVFQPIGSTKIDGYDAYRAIMGCSKLPNNSSEIGYYVAIKGDKDIYIFNKSIRTVAFDTNYPPLTISNANDYISEFMPIGLCKKEGLVAECKR